MNKGFDIAVIGGGVIGLSLAREMRREGLRVAVVDAGATIPAATHAAAGMLAPSFETDHGPGGALGDALYRFSADSLALWTDFAAGLEDETGHSIDYRHDGIMGVAFDAPAAEKLARDARSLRERGALVEMLDGADARRLEPALSARIMAALHAPLDAQVDPRLLFAALKAAFVKAGGIVIEGRVRRADTQGRGFALMLEADAVTVEADAIVLASGAVAGAFVEGMPSPPVSPVKGEAVAVKMEGVALRRVIRAPGAYLCPKAEGRLVIGATEYQGRDDLEVNAAAAAELKQRAAHVAPAVAACGELERWAGLRPGTPDGAPILGRNDKGPENAFLALGHYRNGILLAPASAAALCALILGRKSVHDLSPFRPTRFDPGCSSPAVS